ncbi:hypothetical protein DICVIV_02965 [Dictyocaulus viviparus]|uniref:Uncharacterized protein n=1 Tax=Dictyocaulus viviparus TaxID=29172 RepID=A0A0D8Y8K4_DICVI|nr:hypothetical protein DICVIV_02965 [Dictyocaulus viviparus]
MVIIMISYYQAQTLFKTLLNVYLRMVWSIYSLTGRERVPSPVLTVPIDILLIVMVLQIFTCLKRNMKGSTTERRLRKGCCLRQSKTESKDNNRFNRWRNSVCDISTCEIISVYMVEVHSFNDKLKSILKPQGSDCVAGDAGLEAKIRHRTLTWYPELKMQKRSITRKNYMSFDRTLITKHSPHSGAEAPLSANDLLERKAKYKDKHISWEQECPVFVVYGYDPCRGELEYDENTMDDLSYREAEEIEKNIDKVLSSTLPNKDASKL